MSTAPNFPRESSRIQYIRAQGELYKFIIFLIDFNFIIKYYLNRFFHQLAFQSFFNQRLNA